MEQQSFYTNGVAAFVNLDKTEEYMGQDTGNYSITLAMDDSDAEKLVAMGIKLRDYQGTPQRKFKSKFPIKVVDADGETMSPSDVTWGSTVRVRWTTGKPHPVHGISPYAAAVKVLELKEVEAGDEEF